MLDDPWQDVGRDRAEAQAASARADSTHVGWDHHAKLMMPKVRTKRIQQVTGDQVIKAA